ncbi:helix-turn-helix domain-containing protein [Paraburkholderia aspalathi]|uniref:helix-turn-helix domain-containing protein n=1 Tax=Paraburkholderia aspalathi TaxID=1324617 RepID=UPI0038B7A681
MMKNIRILAQPSETYLLTKKSSTKCTDCAIRRACIPSDLTSLALSHFEKSVSTVQSLLRATTLYRSGDTFVNLYAVRSGSFKTVMTQGNRHDQVVNLHLPGDVLGVEGILTGVLPNTVVALEDSSVCAISYKILKALCQENDDIQSRTHKLMSERIRQESIRSKLLGSIRAEQRVAEFLLDMSNRSLTLGYSPHAFAIRMSRDEIGSYLGIRLETVSRVFSRFHRSGFVSISGKNITIRNMSDLHDIAETAIATGPSARNLQK